MGGRPTTVGAGTVNTSDLPSTRSPNQLTRLLRCTRRRFKRAEAEEEEDHQAEEDTSYRASLATVQYSRVARAAAYWYGIHSMHLTAQACVHAMVPCLVVLPYNVI